MYIPIIHTVVRWSFIAPRRQCGQRMQPFFEEGCTCSAKTTNLPLLALLRNVAVSLVAECWVVIHAKAIGRNAEWWMSRAGVTEGPYTTLLADNTNSSSAVVAISVFCSLKRTHGNGRLA